MIYLLDTSVISILHDPSHPFHGPVLDRFVSLPTDAEVFVHFLSIF